MAVLTPFRAQLRELKRVLPTDAELSTVDRFQGKDAACVLVSFARADASSGLLADPRRLNVALSRARRMLILVGAREAPAAGVAALFAVGGGGAGRRGFIVSLFKIAKSSVREPFTVTIARDPFCQPSKPDQNRRWQSCGAVHRTTHSSIL